MEMAVLLLSLGTGFFVHTGVISAVRMVEFTSDAMLYSVEPATTAARKLPGNELVTTQNIAVACW
jgi:hypothetical protein